MHDHLPDDALERLTPLYYVADPSELAFKQAHAYAWSLEVAESELPDEDALVTLSAQVRSSSR